MKTLRMPISNRGPGGLQVGIEPEGDCFTLEEGEAAEIHYFLEANDEPRIELELEGRLLSVHCTAVLGEELTEERRRAAKQYTVRKEIWRQGRRVK